MKVDFLKPCPFCGGIPDLKEIGNDYTKKRAAQIFCRGCCTKMQVGAIRHCIAWCVEQITKQWNTRIEVHNEKM